MKEEDCLKDLKHLITESQNSLMKTTLSNDEYLLRFIRGRKYNVQRAFETLETNFRIRLEKYPKLFNNLRPSKVKDIFDNGMLGVLKRRDEFGRKIVYYRIKLWDLSTCTADDIMIACILLVEELMASSKETQENGIIMICDYCGFSWAHAKHYSPSHMKMFINIFLFSYPTRFGQGFMLNVPTILEVAYNIFKPILPSKIRDRVFVSHSGHKDLHANLSPSILPQWLGGTLSSEDAEDVELIQNIFRKEEYYANFNK